MNKYKVSNTDEFLSLYKELFPRIYSYVLRSVYCRETAEDITGIVFEKALTYLKKHNKVIDNFQAWLYKIATNELISSHNKKKQKQPLSINDENLALENQLKDDRQDPSMYADFMDIRAAIVKLKPREARLIELYFFEKRSYSDLEEILNEKQGTIRSRLHRTLKKMEQIMKGDAA